MSRVFYQIAIICMKIEQWIYIYNLLVCALAFMRLVFSVCTRIFQENSRTFTEFNPPTLNFGAFFHSLGTSKRFNFPYLCFIEDFPFLKWLLETSVFLTSNLILRYFLVYFHPRESFETYPHFHHHPFSFLRLVVTFIWLR